MSWLSLFLFLIMGGIIFFQSIHGLFSGLIMAVICVLSATVALGAHEALAQRLLYGFLGDYAYAAAFVGLFAICTIVLRVALDKALPRSTLLPGWLDKIGAGAFGLVTGFVCTGVMGIGIQMLPFGPNILGFERIDEDGDTHALWLNPDGFTLQLCGWLAGSTLDSDDDWFSDHPDFLTELHWFRNVESTGSRITVPPDSISVAGELAYTSLLNRVKPSAGGRRGAAASAPEQIKGPPAGKQWLVVGVKLKSDARDGDSKHRASPTQARLVGDTSNGKPAQFAMKAFNANNGGYVLAENHPSWGDTNGEYDLVFEVPEGFSPRFVEYKRAGRARITVPKQMQEKTPAVVLSAAPRPGLTPTGRGGQRGGGATTPVRVERPEKKQSHFGDGLPMVLKRYTGTFDNSGNLLKSGHIVIRVDKQDSSDDGQQGGSGDTDGFDPEGQHLEQLFTPDGTRLLQLNVEAVHARTQLAGLLNLTRRVLQQYRVVDRSGESYLAAGIITEADVGGERLMEIQYWPEEFFQLAGRSPIRRPRRVKHEDLKDDYRFVLLFLVPPGVEITEFDSGNKPIDITDLNLKSPA